jgi:hypothetical protein
MNADPAAQTDPSQNTPTGSQEEPSEQEDRSEIDQRAAYEAELSRISSTDMILQSAVSLLNVGGYRLGLGRTPGAPSTADRDLEQVRDAIDGVRALLAILERRVPQELGPLRDALSQLQIAYAREAQAGGGADVGPQPRQPAERQPPPATEGKPAEPDATGKPGAGPAESSGRLWVPGR